MRSRTLFERKALLKEALPGGKRIRYASHIHDEGLTRFTVAEELQLEGIVGKRGDAPYPGGRSNDWVKIKTAYGRHVDEQRAQWNER